jgi:hypothetical protein
MKTKIITISSCDDCRLRFYQHPNNICSTTGSILPEELDEHYGIPIPDDCPLPDYNP